MTWRLNIILLTLLLLFGLPYYWLLLDNSPRGVAAKPVTIDQLRALAQSVPGAAPESIAVELIASERVPGNFVAAGRGLKRRLLGTMSFRLALPGGAAPVAIDAGMPAGSDSAKGMEHFYLAARSRTDAALREASLVLLTDGSESQAGGLPGGGSNAKAISLSPGAPQAVAPGIVAIPAPSHAPDSRMYFVRLASGREYLFAGDIAPLAVNWQELRGPSRLRSYFQEPADRREVFAWLRTIRRLKSEARGLVVVPGRDYEWLYVTQISTEIRVRTPGSDNRQEAVRP